MNSENFSAGGIKKTKHRGARNTLKKNTDTLEILSIGIAERCTLSTPNYSVSFDKDGLLWVGSVSGLWCFDKSFEKVPEKSVDDLTDIYDIAFFDSYMYVCRRHDDAAIIERYNKNDVNRPAIIVASFKKPSDAFVPSLTACEDKVVNTAHFPAGDCFYVHDVSGGPTKRYKRKNKDRLTCVRYLLPQGTLLLAGDDRVTKLSIDGKDSKTVWERDDLNDIYSVFYDIGNRGIVYATTLKRKRIYIISKTG